MCVCVREDVQKWSIVLGLVCVIVLVPLSSVCHASLHVVGAALGFPAGLCILHAVTAETFDFIDLQTFHHQTTFVRSLLVVEERMRSS